jgi:hypothetical protein
MDLPLDRGTGYLVNVGKISRDVVRKLFTGLYILLDF